MTEMILFSNSILLAIISTERGSRSTLHAFAKYLSDSCWTDDLEYALSNFNIFHYLSLKGDDQSKIHIEEVIEHVEKYYEWLYCQVRTHDSLYCADFILISLQKIHNTSPQAAMHYDTAVDHLDAWLSCIPSYENMGSFHFPPRQSYRPDFNAFFIAISALKFGKMNWTLLGRIAADSPYVIGTSRHLKTIFEGAMEKQAFFREIENVILDPHRTSFKSVQKMDTTSLLLELFCGDYILRAPLQY